MTKALITGISGMVGSHLADFLLENTNWDVYGMLRWRSPLDNINHLIPRINNCDRLSMVYADLRDSESLDDAISKVRPDYVFHLAAQSYPQTSFTSPIDTYDTNILGTERLLHKIRLYCPDAVVHVCSSSEVFGRVASDKLPINEECNFQPASPYAISKVGTDLIGRHYAEAYGMKVMVTRMFTHTGPRRGDVFAESSFAKQIAMIEAGKLGGTIEVGNLDSMRTWTDVRDAVEAYYLLVTANPIPGEVYNIGGVFSTSVGEMLHSLIHLSDLKPSEVKICVKPERLRPIDADLQIPDVKKFIAHTGWTPKIPFDQTIFDLLNYWREKILQQNFLKR